MCRGFFKTFSALSLFGAFMLFSASSTVAGSPELAPVSSLSTSICDIYKDDAVYDGKTVHIHTHFLAWWEGSLLQDPACSRGGSYSLDFVNGYEPNETFFKRISAYWRDDIIEYDLEFDAVYDAKDSAGPWGHAQTGTFENIKIAAFKSLGPWKPHASPDVNADGQ